MAYRYFSARELAGLPGMPGTERSVLRHADLKSWPSRPRQSAGRGRNGREYPLSCLPEETQRALLARLVDAAASTLLPALIPEVVPPSQPQSRLPAVAAPGVVAPRAPVMVTRNVRLKLPAAPADGVQTPEALKDWQRQRMDARLAILELVDEVAMSHGVDAAVSHIVEMAARYELPSHIQSMIPSANARRGDDDARTLSRRTVYRWISAREEGAGALAPRPVERYGVPLWAPAFLSLFQRPQKPFLSEALSLLPQLLPAEIPAPSYWAVRRFLSRVNVVDRHRGRMGPREIRKIRIFVRRDFSLFLPGDIYEADGHTFDAEVAHPFHGRPFRPECELVLDVVTRKAVGWSAGLAESTWTVIDALRHASEKVCLPAIYYVDRGSGRNNHLLNDLSTGFIARLGITKTHSIPYNSQARGAVERAHQTIFVGVARTLSTYIGKPMDPEAKKKVFTATRLAVVQKVSSPLLPSWEEFKSAVDEAIAAYNARPHRALPKFRDPSTGTLRHMSPDERWAQFVAEGFEPVRITPEESNDLFRPYEVRTCQRGEVGLRKNRYFHKALEGYHGQRVRVGFDIHDASRVWVRDLDGRLICVAGFEANSRAFYPVPFVERKREERAQGRLRRLELQADEVRAELAGASNTVDAEYADDLTPEEKERAEQSLKALCAPAPEDDDPVDDDIKFWRWGIAHLDELSEEQRRYLDDRIERSSAFRALLGIDDDTGFNQPSGCCIPAV